MTNNTSGMNTEIKVNGQKLETVTSFKYLGSVITDEGSKPEILSRIAQTTAAFTKTKPVWIDKSNSLSSKIRLMRSLVTSIFLHACESWTLTAELQKKKKKKKKEEKRRRQGRQEKRWEDNVREWTGLEFSKSQRAVENREIWRKLVVKSSMVPQQPLWLSDRLRR